MELTTEAKVLLLLGMSSLGNKGGNSTWKIMASLFPPLSGPSSSILFSSFVVICCCLPSHSLCCKYGLVKRLSNSVPLVGARRREGSAIVEEGMSRQYSVGAGTKVAILGLFHLLLSWCSELDSPYCAAAWHQHITIKSTHI